MLGVVECQVWGTEVLPRGHPLGGMLGAKGPIGPIPVDTPQPSGDLR